MVRVHVTQQASSSWTLDPTTWGFFFVTTRTRIFIAQQIFLFCLLLQYSLLLHFSRIIIFRSTRIIFLLFFIKYVTFIHLKNLFTMSELNALLWYIESLKKSSVCQVIFETSSLDLRTLLLHPGSDSQCNLPGLECGLR